MTGFDLDNCSIKQLHSSTNKTRRPGNTNKGGKNLYPPFFEIEGITSLHLSRYKEQDEIQCMYDVLALMFLLDDASYLRKTDLKPMAITRKSGFVGKSRVAGFK